MHEDLVNWFFNENGLDKEGVPPTAAIEHFHIKLFLSDSPVMDMMDDSIRQKLPEREKATQDEKNEIESAQTCEQVLRLLRRGADIMNQQVLVRRALAFEDEIVPEIIRMLKTSKNDLFIELSTRVLAVCNMDITNDLVALYDDAHNPYAKSLILLAAGFKAPEKRIPWIVKKFNELKKDYPNDGYCYGAYYALFEMDLRFYDKGRKFSASSIAESKQ